MTNIFSYKHRHATRLRRPRSTIKRTQKEWRYNTLEEIHKIIPEIDCTSKILIIELQSDPRSAQKILLITELPEFMKISAEMFETLQNDVIKLAYMISKQTWKTQIRKRDWKRSIYIQQQKRAGTQNDQNPQ